MFSCEFCENLRIPFLKKYFRWLPLCNSTVDSKSLPIHFYYWFLNNCYAQKFSFNSSYITDQLFFEIDFFHNSCLQEQPPEMFYKKKNVLKNLASYQSCNFIKKRLQRRCFSLNIANFLRKAILINICQRLLL